MSTYYGGLPRGKVIFRGKVIKSRVIMSCVDLNTNTGHKPPSLAQFHFWSLLTALFSTHYCMHVKAGVKSKLGNYTTSLFVRGLPAVTCCKYSSHFYQSGYIVPTSLYSYPYSTTLSKYKSAQRVENTDGEFACFALLRRVT